MVGHVNFGVTLGEKKMPKNNLDTFFLTNIKITINYLKNKTKTISKYNDYHRQKHT